MNASESDLPVSDYRKAVLDHQLILKERMRRVKHKVAVISGKGGVGKSTVIVNLAVAFANRKNRGSSSWRAVLSERASKGAFARPAPGKHPGQRVIPPHIVVKQH